MEQEQHSPRFISLSRAAALVALALLTNVARADGGTIYRCHSAKDGALIFQDQPCNKAPGTLEAAKNLEGAVIPPAPPPADDGAPVVERYTRYLDAVAADREAQKEADLAAASRLRARGDAEREPAPFAPPQVQGNCTLIGANDECLAYANDYGSYGGYSGYYGPAVPAYNGPYRRRPVDRPRPPPPVTPPAPPAPAARFGAPFRPGFGTPAADEKASK